MRYKTGSREHLQVWIVFWTSTLFRKSLVWCLSFQAKLFLKQNITAKLVWQLATTSGRSFLFPHSFLSQLHISHLFIHAVVVVRPRLSQCKLLNHQYNIFQSSTRLCSAGLLPEPAYKEGHSQEGDQTIKLSKAAMQHSSHDLLYQNK